MTMAGMVPTDSVDDFPLITMTEAPAPSDKVVPLTVIAVDPGRRVCPEITKDPPGSSVNVELPRVKAGAVMMVARVSVTPLTTAMLDDAPVPSDMVFPFATITPPGVSV